MQEIDSQKKRLDALFVKAEDFSNDAELLSHWSKYLCVLVCGFLENSVELCLREYCKNRADGKTANFVSKQLKSFQNPKMGKILELFGAFSGDWEDQLKKRSEGQISDAINSIVTNRHLIAHGGRSDLSFSRLKSYYKSVVEGVQIMKGICSSNDSIGIP